MWIMIAISIVLNIVSMFVLLSLGVKAHYVGKLKKDLTRIKYYQRFVTNRERYDEDLLKTKRKVREMEKELKAKHGIVPRKIKRMPIKSHYVP